MYYFRFLLISFNLLSLFSKCTPASILLRPIINMREFNNLRYDQSNTENIYKSTVAESNSIEARSDSITTRPNNDRNKILCVSGIDCNRTNASCSITNDEKKGIEDLYRRGRPACVKKHRQQVNLQNKYNSETTTSTMAPLVNENSHNTPPKSKNDKLKCDRIAKCKERIW
ncbi:hypothetical protein ACJJTC_005486 [Scirpophaga incertulas]